MIGGVAHLFTGSAPTATGTAPEANAKPACVDHLRESFTTAPTELSGASVSVSAGNTLSTYGTRISSSGRAELQAGGAANYYAVYDQINNRDDSHKTRSFLGIRYSSSRSSSSRVENTPLVTRLQSEAELVSYSGGDTLLQGTQVRANGGYAINAGVGDKARADARIILEGVRTTVQESKTAKSDYVVWQSMSGSGSTSQTLALPSFAGGGTFTAPGGLSVQIPEGNFKSQIQTLSQQPGMSYLNDLAARTDVNWQAVKLANEQWNYSQSGLTPAGAALLGAAVAWATGGIGANLIGGTVTTTTATGAAVTSYTTAGLMANAAFTSLAAQASITLVNNKGDIGKTLKDMSSSSTVKAALAAALTAGVLEKIGASSTMTELGKTGQFADKLTYNLINATGRALTTTAINGGDLQGALKAALVGGLVDTAHGQAASAIKGLEADYLAHKLAHALVGCVAGAAASGACKDGAIGGAVGEIVAQMMPPKNGIAYSDSEKSNVLALSKLVAGATSAYAGGNAQTAITTAEVAVQNNALVPALIGLAWLADKAWTAYEVSQDVAAIRDGTKTVEQVATEKGTDYVINVIAGNVARYGVKVVQHIVKKDGLDVVSGVSQTRVSPAQLKQNQAQRQVELQQVFDPANPRQGITVGNQSYLPKPGQSVPIYEGMSPKQVQDYFLELTGTAGLPAPIKVPGRVGGETMYVVKTDKGSFTLRDFASSTDKSGPVWTIDVPRSMLPTNYKGSPEIKFLK
jgi:hypothetical protein